MAQLVVAAAGAALGSMAGPLGAKIGWMAGAMIGGALFKPDPQQGPRVEDKKASASTYGETIPTVWGTDRCKAQFLWASDLIEAEQDVGGGKGLGGAEGVIYTYSVNVLIGVCKSPFAKPRYPLRLWGNGRLIATFNGTGWDVDKALIQRAGVREYIGAQDQMPDPVYEAAVGAENAPAYRGQLSIMLEGLQLADFGNRAPNFEVEVTDNLNVVACPLDSIKVTAPQNPYLYTGSSATWSHSRFGAAFDPTTGLYYVLTSDDPGMRGAKQLEIYALGVDLAPVLRQVVPLSIFGSMTVFGGITIDPENRELWIVAGEGSSGAPAWTIPVALIVQLDSLSITPSKAMLGSWNDKCDSQCAAIVRAWGSYENPSKAGGDARDAGTGAQYGAMFRIHPAGGGEVSWGIHGTSIIQYRFVRLRNGAPAGIECVGLPLCTVSTALGNGRGWHAHGASEGAVGASNAIGDVLYIPQPGADVSPGNQWVGGINYQAQWDESLVRMIDDDSSTTITGGGSAAGGSKHTFVVFSKSRKKVFVVRDAYCAAIDLDPVSGNPAAFAAPFAELASVAALGAPHFAVWSEYHDGVLMGALDSNSLWMAVIDPETDEVLSGPCEYGDWNPAYGDMLAPVEIGSGWFGALTQFGDRIATFNAPGGFAGGGGRMLGEIVAEICTDPAIGLTAGQIDVSPLTDIVPGFTIARQVAARGAIDTLAQAWFFYGVESSDKFAFRKHGGTSVATIESGELGAHVFQLTQSEPEPPYELEHIDEIEAPRQLTVKYIDAAANYDPGTQLAARQVGGSLSPATLDLPIVLDTDYAAQVAWTHLMRQHGGKKPIKFALTHAHEAIEPGDPITVPLSNGEAVRVVVANKVSARPLVEFDGVLEDGAVWDAIFPGVDRGQLPRQDAPATLASTVMEVLDLPPLRAEDNRIVAYVAMSRASGEGWPGATAYRSSDGGATFSALFSTSAEATMGYTTSVLPAWTEGNIFDRESTVRVWLRRGTLSSATELAVCNGANACVIGNEIVQFANATLVGENEWELSALLRHRIGTEWAALSDRAAGARFVLLSAAALRAIEYTLGDMNVARQYKAVTAGRPLADGAVQLATLIGNSVKPLSPVHVRGARDGSGNLAVTWIGRARMNAEWQDEFDVPLDEPSEQYRVIVFADASRTAIKRTVDVTAAQWTYTDADQAADFGAVQADVHMNVYQITPTYNALGHPAEVSL